MNVALFIVMEHDTRLGDTRSRDKTYQYTVGGAVIFPVGAYVPVIRSGDGCLGIAQIISTEMRETSTTVTFKFVERDGNYQALYKLYKLNARMQKTGSDEDEDSYYPGRPDADVSREDLLNIFRD